MIHNQVAHQRNNFERNLKEEKLERERTRVKLEIENKFSSPAWLRSPYRDLEYACCRYTLDVVKVLNKNKKKKEKPQKVFYCHQPIKQTVRDIYDTLRRRAERAKNDPAASWDYVTNTLSEDEMREVATRLARTKIENDYLD